MTCRHPAPWNHLAEVVLGDPRVGSYIGDMPHTWAGASLVNAVIAMLLRESGGQLVLFDGAPEKWFRDGQGVTLKNVPTYFGKLDLTARAVGRRLVVDVGDGVRPPGGFDLRWPLAGMPSPVSADGQSIAAGPSGCTLPPGTRQIVAEWPE